MIGRQLFTILAAGNFFCSLHKVQVSNRMTLKEEKQNAVKVFLHTFTNDIIKVFLVKNM